MIELKNVSFSYENGNSTGELRDINITVPDGQTVLICGESGCGKTTLTRLINGLIPDYYEGKLEGTISIDGQVISAKPLYNIAPIVGSVFQNPRSQFFAVDTNSELAFGCENLGLSIDEIKDRMRTVVSDFQIEYLMERSIFALSGGEKQKIACGSAAMVRPKVFVLDEPSSNLDIKSIGELAKVIALWKAQKKTILIAEHRLSYLMGLADRILYMQQGRIVRDMMIQEFQAISSKEIVEMGLRSRTSVSFQNCKEAIHTPDMLKLCDFHFTYGGLLDLDIDHLNIPKGSIVGIVGNNGAGKTTFARCLCGLEKKSSGTVKIGKQAYTGKKLLNQCYMVMQNPSHQLFTEDVLDEVLLSMEGDEGVNRSAAEEILSGLNLQQFSERHPMSLSGGQQQRVAIASAIASGRNIMVFDEPTSGLDYRHMEEVAVVLERLQQMGKTLFIITHDPELIERCCDYFIFIESGKVLWSGSWDDKNRRSLLDFFTLSTRW